MTRNCACHLLASWSPLGVSCPDVPNAALRATSGPRGLCVDLGEACLNSWHHRRVDRHRTCNLVDVGVEELLPGGVPAADLPADLTVQPGVALEDRLAEVAGAPQVRQGGLPPQRVADF